MQRALEATETTSNSQISTALEGITTLIQDVLGVNVVSVYKVQQALP